MTDQLDDLFADLRADTMTQVRPPGAVAARHTLRRRRTRRTVGAAAFLMVAGAGGLSTTLLPRGEQAEASELAERAAAVVNVDPDAPNSRSGVATSGVVATGVMVAGHYTLTLACVGRGWLGVSLRTGDERITSIGTDCGTGSTEARSMQFTLLSTLPVVTELHTAGGAAGQAGYAYQAVLAESDKDRLHDVAREQLSGTGDDFWLAGFLPLTPVDQRVLTEPGRYRAVIACAGTGQLSFTVESSVGGTARTGATISAVCGPPTMNQEVTFEVLPGGSAQTSLEPDAVARGQAAVAVRLDRL